VQNHIRRAWCYESCQAAFITFFKKADWEKSPSALFESERWGSLVVQIFNTTVAAASALVIMLFGIGGSPRIN